MYHNQRMFSPAPCPNVRRLLAKVHAGVMQGKMGKRCISRDMYATAAVAAGQYTCSEYIVNEPPRAFYVVRFG